MRLRTGQYQPARPDNKPALHWSKVYIPPEAYSETTVGDMGTGKPHMKRSRISTPRTPVTAVRKREWVLDAECANYPSDWWFAPSHSSTGQAQVEKALAICDGCPVKTQCRQDAESHTVRHGIWGGINYGLSVGNGK